MKNFVTPFGSVAKKRANFSEFYIYSISQKYYNF